MASAIIDNMHTLKELIKDHTVVFKYYRDNCLWYNIDQTDFTFPVPVSDTGDTTFPCMDKAIFFMKWIKLYLQAIQNDETHSRVDTE